MCQWVWSTPVFNFGKLATMHFEKVIYTPEGPKAAIFSKNVARFGENVVELLAADSINHIEIESIIILCLTLF